MRQKQLRHRRLQGLLTSSRYPFDDDRRRCRSNHGKNLEFRPRSRPPATEAKRVRHPNCWSCAVGVKAVLGGAYRYGLACRTNQHDFSASELTPLWLERGDMHLVEMDGKSMRTSRRYRRSSMAALPDPLSRIYRCSELLPSIRGRQGFHGGSSDEVAEPVDHACGEFSKQ